MRKIVTSMQLSAFVFALITGLIGTAHAQQTIAIPANDPFYVPPVGYETLPNGTVLNSRQIVPEYILPPLDTGLRALPGNVGAALLPQLKTLQNQGIDAYQVLYKSTDSKSQPVAEAATILVPHGPWIGSGTRPLVSYQSAEDSTGTSCEPSYTLRTGILGAGALGVSTYDVVLALLPLLQGYAVVIADYEGPNSEFTVGMQAAHAVLDGIRAALSYSPAGLSPSTKVALWGYSGGGQSTGWAAEQKQLYAPELNVVGAAVGASPSDLEAVLQRNNGTATAGFIPLALVGQELAYPESGIDTIFNTQGQQILAKASNVCTGVSLAGNAFLNIDNITTVANPIQSPAAEYIYEKSNLGQVIPSIPIFNYQEQLDEIVPVDMNNQLAQKYCTAGAQVLTIRTSTALPFGGTVHIAGALAGAPLALAYLNAVFSNTAPQLPGMLVPTLNNCPSNIPSLINSLPLWDPTRIALALQPWPWQSY